MNESKKMGALPACRRVCKALCAKHSARQYADCTYEGEVRAAVAAQYCLLTQRAD